MLDQILAVNLAGTTLVFYVAARIYLLPRLGSIPRERILLPILLLHSTRHLGLMFLAPGAVHDGMPPQFAYPAALCDLLAALLALVSIPAVVNGWRAARPLVWVFNVLGAADLLLAISLATVYEAARFMGAAYWIPAFWVPALLVTHYLTFEVLRSQPAWGAFSRDRVQAPRVAGPRPG